MPFGPIEWPTLGIGLLLSAAKKAGLKAKAIYPSLYFAEAIGIQMYNLISTSTKPDSLLGEWLFSGSAFPGFKSPDGENFPFYFKKEFHFAELICTFYKKDPDCFMDEFISIRNIAEGFVEKTAVEIVNEGPKIVGCSASFMQYASSLALLRKIKELNPSIVTLLGGANCEGEMGYITKKNCGWIDFVVSGEADTVFPDLCKKILTNGTNLSKSEIPFGVYSKGKLLNDSKENAKVPAEIIFINKINRLPVPDYFDYFSDLEKTKLKNEITPVIFMETSRGCWKGRKQPCNFCGLNGEKIDYRAKSSDRVLIELDDLYQAYGINEFLLTDNILNMRHFKTLFKELSKAKKPYRIFLESPSNLNEAQFELLAAAGVCWLQPGIESLHDAILKLLNKGTSAIHNIAFLKYAIEKGIKISWNLLHGMPGDSDRYYKEMADFFPLLSHLEPPNTLTIRFDRFSEYFKKQKQFGLTLSPSKFYKYVYPFQKEDMSNFAYFFEDTSCSKAQKTEKQSVEEMKRIVNKWRLIFYYKSKRPKLVLFEKENQTVIIDTRPCAVSSEHILTGIDNCIFKACRAPVSKQEILSAAKLKYDKQSFENGLKSLVEKKLLLQINGHFLALANLKPEKEIIDGFEISKIFSNGGQKNSLKINKQTENLAWDWFESVSV